MNHIDALDVGFAYGLAGTLFDEHADRIETALATLEQNYVPPTPQSTSPIQIQLVEPHFEVVNNLPLGLPDDWDDYVGQVALKNELLVRIHSAQQRGVRLPHVLLASGMPGVGKTFMAELLAKIMGVPMIELVPPFSIDTIIEAALQLPDGGILFIDEIHKLADSGKRGAEILLKILEKGIAIVKGRPVQLPDLTYIAATTDKGRLPRPVIDRFPIQPQFEPYTPGDLTSIALQFAHRHNCLDDITDETAVAIAQASRKTPRIAGQMVEAARDLAQVYGRPPVPDEVLDFLRVEPNGMGLAHIEYLTTLRTYFGRNTRTGVMYMSGAPSLQSKLHLDGEELVEVETFLIDLGYINKTPQGRALTMSGVAAAEEYMSQRKGVAAVA